MGFARIVARVFVGSLLAGCTLLTSINDLTVVPDSDSDASSGDAATPTSDGPITDSFFQDVAPVTVDGCSEASCFDVPPEFTLVAFGGTAKGAACPAGFGQSSDTVEGPTVGASACSCSCNVTTQPSCQQGSLTSFFGVMGAGLCGNDGAAMMNNGCSTDGFLGPFGVGNEHRHTPPGPSGGACTAAASKDNNKLAFAAEGSVCQATIVPRCGTKVCPPTVASPFRACIAAEGDIACPAAFSEKHLVGSSASFTCSSGCTCSGVTATCAGGTLNFYATTNCSGASGFSYAVNNTCVPSTAAGATFASYRYVASPPSNVACSKAGSTSPSAPQVGQATTICCN